jgi:ABC-type multidrug transport system, ATPase component
MNGRPAISLRGLTKDYGSLRALNGEDLEVESGEIFGLLGPNGAGKSTTIRVLLDLLRPTAGQADILGIPSRQATPALRARVGYLPGELSLPPNKTAGGYLRYLAALRGGVGVDRIPGLAERFSLDVTQTMRSLSKGNKQKVGVVQAFMHSPELLILDEPTSGLDPFLQREFLNLVRETHDAAAGPRWYSGFSSPASDGADVCGAEEAREGRGFHLADGTAGGAGHGHQCRIHSVRPGAVRPGPRRDRQLQLRFAWHRRRAHTRRRRCLEHPATRDTGCLEPTDHHQDPAMTVDSLRVLAIHALGRPQTDTKSNRHNRKLTVNTTIHPAQPNSNAVPTTAASVAR